jgi:hypothetical protein
MLNVKKKKIIINQVLTEDIKFIELVVLIELTFLKLKHMGFSKD